MIFVYGLIDPRTNELRYIGKTRRGMVRPREHWDKYGLKRNDKCHRWVLKLSKLGLIPHVEVLEECRLDDLDDCERFWISSLRAAGAELLNMTDGGEGGALIMDDVTRAKFSHPGERNPFFGRKHSAETRRKISDAKRGKPSGLKGKPKPPGFGAKMSAILTGRKQSPEFIAKRFAKIRARKESK